MKISRLRLKNYKSFRDSGSIALADGFNVFLGRNNSGKSALIETLRRGANASKPHRDPSMDKNSPSNPASLFELDVVLSADEMRQSLLRRGEAIRVPLEPNGDADDLANTIFEKRGATITLSSHGGGGPLAPEYPSHRLFDYHPANAKISFGVVPDPDRQGYTMRGASNNDTDQLLALADEIAGRKIFVFSAERLNVSRVAFDVSAQISGNASNLPRALSAMMAQPALWREFVANVNRVIPNVKDVVADGVPGTNQIEIKIWPVDSSSRRDDLIVQLSDSGTGVGQVLAILCAAMTNERAVIAIDEPNNFLHPGAVKTLIDVLKQYEHQYIITTHSLDAVLSANPKHVYFVEWNDCVSSIRDANLANVEDHKRALAELGVSLSDVFGVERILWVEGETEEVCLPILIREHVGYMPANLLVVRLRSTGELVGKKRVELARDVYRRVSSLGGLIPTRSPFLLDREKLSQQDVDDIRRESGNTVHFLPRRAYENYLLAHEILLAEMNSEAAVNGTPAVTQNALKDWFDKNAGKFGATWAGNADPNWLAAVDAPKLLSALFRQMLNVEYAKTRHSPSLTRRLVASKSPELEELKRIVGEVVEN